MADADKDAQRKEIKDLLKEAISEWQTEEASRRTKDGPDKDKKDGGFFGAFFG